MTQYEKDPSARLDYSVDWADYLEEAETISTSSWSVPGGLNKGSGDYAPTTSATRAKVWLSGGTAGQSYVVTNRITTSGGRLDERSFVVVVKQR